jgi:hypothetical protein
MNSVWTGLEIHSVSWYLNVVKLCLLYERGISKAVTIHPPWGRIVTWVN